MSDAARYAVLGGTIEKADGEPDIAFTLGRFGDTGLINHGNWSGMGLRATASHDLECRDLRIPRTECFIAPASTVQQILLSKSVNRVVNSATGAVGILGIWLGAAQAAFDFTLEYVRGRYGYLATGPLAAQVSSYRSDEAWAQSAIGNMDHWLGTGRWILYDLVARLEGGAAATDPALSRDVVRTVFHLRRMTEEVALGTMKTCGAHAYVTTRPLERIFRDLMGGVVMAWKTDQLQHTLGLGALGHSVTFTGPGGS